MPCGSARTLYPCLAFLSLACTPLRAPKEVAPEVKQTPQEKGERVAALLATAPNYDHFEGVAFRNSCTEDSDCHVGGCSAEICSSDVDATSACVVYNDKPTSPCGCVNGQCIWYVTGAAADEIRAAQKAAAEAPAAPKRRPDNAPPSGGLPDQGQACADGRCAPGLECVTFFGIGGPKAGAFTSCEIRCAAGRPCPRGQACASIADGPGNVCRPESQVSPPK